MELEADAAETIARLSRLADKLERVLSERPVASAQQPEALLDARQVANRLGVTRDWVYEHASELGAIRIGGGRRPRLRFPPDLAAADAGQNPARREARPQGHTQPSANGRRTGLIEIYDG